MLDADVPSQGRGKSHVDKSRGGLDGRKTGIICGRPLWTTP